MISDLFDTVVLRFCADWTTQLLSSFTYYIFAMPAFSFYTGTCFYIQAMVGDLKRKMSVLNDILITESGQRKLLGIYCNLLHEISFHNDILE